MMAVGLMIKKLNSPDLMSRLGGNVILIGGFPEAQKPRLLVVGT
jgi:hypothetical protein